MLNDNQKKVVEDNIELVYFVIDELKTLLFPDYMTGDRETRHINHSHNTVGDFLGAGYEGLCKAAIHYDKSTDIKFSTYAHIAIKRHILREYNRNKLGSINSNNDLILSLDTPMGECNNGVYPCLLDTLIDDKDNYLNTESWMTIKEVINKSRIRNKDRMFNIILLYSYGYTHEEIGEIYGVSRQCIEQQILRVRKLVKEYT